MHLNFSFIISGFVIGRMYQYFGFNASAHSMAFIIFLMVRYNFKKLSIVSVDGFEIFSVCKQWSVLRFCKNDSKTWKLLVDDDPRIRAISTFKDFPESKAACLGYQTFAWNELRKQRFFCIKRSLHQTKLASNCD